VSLEDRVSKLEAAQPRISHHRTVCEVPADMATDAYLASLPCPCGAVGCDRQTFGLIVPRRLHKEPWTAQAQSFYERHRA
jgi:hypothetical protein